MLGGGDALQRASAEIGRWVRGWVGRAHSGQQEQPMQSPRGTEWLVYRLCEPGQLYPPLHVPLKAAKAGRTSKADLTLGR